MKRLHRKDLFCWSGFSERLNVDFNGFAWIREGGNLLIDPMPMSAHDRAHLRELGGAAHVVLTNSAHVRGTVELVAELGARVMAPAAERAAFPIPVDRFLEDGETVVPGLTALALAGSKTPGELALLLDETTLICGDLVRAHRAGSLMLLLPGQGLVDPDAARASVERLAALPRVEAVLVGDGWCVFERGREHLLALAAELRG